MGRIRTIKPEFPQSQSMGNVSRDARLLFILLWTLADDAGRTRGDPRMLAGLLFPYDRDAPDLIGGWLAELEREGCVLRYRVGGSPYLQVSNWKKHQRINRASGPQCPEPPPNTSPPCSEDGFSESSVNAHGGLTAGSGPGSGPGPGPVSGPGPGPGADSAMADTEPTAQARRATDSESDSPDGWTREGEPSPDPLLGMPLARGKQRSVDFEEINRRVGKLLDEGGADADDVDALARQSGFTKRQVVASLRQLRDRGLL